jgi:hypothetical protein
MWSEGLTRCSQTAVAAGFALLLFGCGDDKHATTYDPIGAGDAGGSDAGHHHASAPGPGDAGEHDHVIHSGDLALCAYDDEDVLELPGNAALGEVAIANDEHGFALAFHDADGGLWIDAVPLAGAADAPVHITRAADEPSAAALVTSTRQLLLGWRSDSGATPVLHAREMSTTDHAAIELTGALADGKAGGQLFALLGLDAGFVAAYVQIIGGKPELRAQRIDDDGRAHGDAVAIAGVAARVPEDLHLARLDADELLLAWLERDADGAGQVMGLVLSPQLAVQGKPLRLSQFAAHDARFDLAARRLSVGLVYHALDGGTRDAIKYRRIGADGSVSEPAFNVVEAPGRARDASIAAFGQGYAVAYRVLPSLGVDNAGLRVAFINQFGAIVHVADLGETSEAGGRTTLSATADGHLLVGHTHVGPSASSASTRALAMYCPGALKLCGGKTE